jgi:LCP family protein required for cell wall assembly
MDEVKVNFIKKELPKKAKRGFFFFGRAFGFTVAVGAIGVSVASFAFARQLPPGDSVLDQIPVVSEIRSFIFSSERPTETDDGRTNILFLGIGGAGHDGPQLSDTILLATLDHTSHRAGIISLPRDLLVEVPDHAEQKLNAANAYGEENGFGEGPKVASGVVETIIGSNIDYYVRVDFKAFEDIVNDIDGVDVNVDRPFVDMQYPTEDFGYETITFDSGMQHMNGATALKYTRSRHGTNGEGSDFARSARQQKILHAVKTKLLSSSTFLSPVTIGNILKTLKSHVVTNLTPLEMISLFSEYRDIGQKDVVTKVLVPGDDQPLYETYVNGSYVILPKNPDWSELQTYVKGIFDAPVKATEVALAPAHVEIQNGTTVNGLARETAGKIAKNGFVVAKICNASERGITTTTILDLTHGKRAADLNRLKKILSAEAIVPKNDWKYTTEITPTDGVQPVDPNAQPKDLDFLVILGSPAQVSTR